MNWKNDAIKIIQLVGGKENIKEILHCATRLRFKFKDDSLANLDEVKKIPIVKGYNLQQDQHQLIIGPGSVDKLYKAVMSILEINNENLDFAIQKKEKIWNKEFSVGSNILIISKKGMGSFASIFIPLIPIFIAGGMSLALVSLIKQIDQDNGFAQLLDIIGGAILGSLPAFVGYTAAKKWGGNGYLGMAMGIVLIAPALLNSYSNSSLIMLGFDINESQDVIDAAVNDAFANWQAQNPNSGDIEVGQVVGTYKTLFSGFFKIKLIGYQAQIIPVLLVLALSVNLEKLLRKYIPDVIGVIIVPLFTVVFVSWLAFWAIGPLGQIIGEGLAEGITAIFKYTNYTGVGFGGMIFAGFYPILVITGLHQGFLPIESQLLMDTKLQFGHSFSFITPVACVSNIAQGTAALVWILYTKNKTERSKAASGAVGANFGITEPAMFGINLQIKPLLVAAICGSAIAGYWLGMTHTVANSLGSASWIGLVQFDWTSEYSQNYFEVNNIHATLTSWAPGVHVTIAMTISMVSTAIIAWFLMRTKWGKNSIEQYNIRMNISTEIPVSKNKGKK